MRSSTVKYADLKSTQNLTGGGTTESIENSEELANLLNERMTGRQGGNNQRLAIMLGWYTREKTIKANIPDKDRSQFSQERWKFFLDAPFEISNKCCTIMKKNPSHDYNKKTGRHPMLASMADESRLRMQKWLENGCNGFHLKEPVSNPMSFWTEQDVLQYIYEHNLPICSVYGDVVEDYEAEGMIDGQMSLLENKKTIYKTTGCNRTGCVLCSFGAHCEKKGEGRFERLKGTHPKFYELLDICKNNGVTYRESIEWTNEHLDPNHQIWL